MSSPQYPTGPGSAQEMPPAAGQFPVDPATLPQAVRDELQAPDPVAIDTSSPELRDGQNHCPKCGATEIRQRAGTDQLV
ncbi:MAG: TFIIB-type zinc ribbon-containing protein, partial [Comamonas sp.]|nr:TFIIB-type zinc ribbon-containing protein [Candidatus Comamonas equi]